MIQGFEKISIHSEDNANCWELIQYSLKKTNWLWKKCDTFMLKKYKFIRHINWNDYKIF